MSQICDEGQLVIDLNGGRYVTSVTYDEDYRTSGHTILNGRVVIVGNTDIDPLMYYGNSNTWTVEVIEREIPPEALAYLESFQQCVCSECERIRIVNAGGGLYGTMLLDEPHALLCRISFKHEQEEADHD